MYIDVADMDVSMQTMTFTSLIAGDSGGGIYASDWQEVTMDAITVTEAYAPAAGAFLYSNSPAASGTTFVIDNSDFQCQTI